LHWVARARDDLLKKLSKNEKFYAIPQRAALVYDNDVLSFVGEVLLFENGEKIRVTEPIKQVSF